MRLFHIRLEIPVIADEWYVESEDQCESTKKEAKRSKAIRFRRIKL